MKVMFCQNFIDCALNFLVKFEKTAVFEMKVMFCQNFIDCIVIARACRHLE